MKKIFIIGCGLLGSSLVRRIAKKKLVNLAKEKMEKSSLFQESSLGNSAKKLKDLQ